MDLVSYDTTNGPELRPTRFAGRTMDLTLFAVTRALDVMVGELWSQRRLRKIALGEWSNVSEGPSEYLHQTTDSWKGRQTNIGLD